METDQAIFLGIVQGLTEFLPVSSSGHLVIFQKFLKIPEHDLAFDVAVHLGTLCSVLVIYFRSLTLYGQDFLTFLKKRRTNDGAVAVGLVIMGSIPTAFIGLKFKDQFEHLFSSLLAVGLCLCITGVFLFLTRIQTANRMLFLPDREFQGLTWWKAFLIGTVQGLAIAPGISRSGATISVGMFLGVPGDVAARYSFLLAIPAMLGAAFLQLKGVQLDASPHLIVGFISAFISGLLGLWAILKVVKKGRLEYFSPYLILLGCGLILWDVFN